MAGKLEIHEIWWAKELTHVANVISESGLLLLTDDSIDELHSFSSRIHSLVTSEYRKRMGVMQ